jgi:outer membrane receptor protein involved in Fe transport
LALLQASAPVLLLAHEPVEPKEPPISITVKGAPREPLTASSTLVLAEEFERVPRRSAEDALSLVPGVTLVQHGSEGKGYQFLVRGFDAAHGADFEVSVDGMPLNEWSNVHAQGYLDLGFVIPELVSSVRVTKGPFTLGQGAFAMAGSASYHLGVAPEDRGLRAAYTMGSTNRQRGLVTYSPHDGDGHEFIASETLHDEGFGSRRGVSKGTVLARSELVHSERYGNLSLLSGGYLARFELPGALRADHLDAGLVQFRDSYTQSSRGASMRALTALAYEKHHGPHSVHGMAYTGLRRLEVYENFTGYLLHPSDGDFRAQHQDTLNFGLALSLTSRLLPVLVANLSLGVTGGALEQQQWHVDAADQPLATERNLSAVQALTHAAAGITFEPVEGVRLDAGVRLDVAHVSVDDELIGGERSAGTLAAVSPRTIVQWQALSGLRLLAAYGRGFRPPEARAFSAFEPAQVGVSEERFEGGEPAMTTSDSFEIGARCRVSQRLLAQASAFATLIARESVYDHVSGVNVELNATRRLGAELALRSPLTHYLTISADATLVDARFRDSGSPVPLAPTLFGSARALLGEGHGPRGGVRLLAVAPRPLPHGAESSTLIQLDLTAGYFWEHWRVELELENLLNQARRDGEYHFASQWQRNTPASSLPSLHYVAGPPFNARLTVSAVF